MTFGSTRMRAPISSSPACRARRSSTSVAESRTLRPCPRAAGSSSATQPSNRLGEQSEILLARASKLLDSTDQLVATLNRSASKLRPERIDETLLETQKLVRHLGRTADEMNRTVVETRGPLLRTLSTAEGTLKEVDRLGRRSDAVLENLDSTITDLRGVVRANDDDLRTTFENLRQASASFKALSRDLRRRPNLLLFGGAAPERKLP